MIALEAESAVRREAEAAHRIVYLSTSIDLSRPFSISPDLSR